MFVFAGVLFVIYRDRGIPLDREQLLGLIVATLAVASIGSRTKPLRVVLDWLPFAILLLAYDYSRGAADAFPTPTQWRLPANVDAALFGEVPSVFLQPRLLDPDRVAWWESIIAITYVSHFVVPYVVAGVLWWKDRIEWKRWVWRFVVLSAAGVVTYVLLPTAPPWMASNEGIIGPVARVSTRGWRYLHLGVADRLLEKGQATSNLVAALPSLHAAYPALLLFFFWSRASITVRSMLVGYALLMGFTLVLMGEHYVFDVFAGWLYAGLACMGLSAIETRREARRSDVMVESSLSVP